MASSLKDFYSPAVVRRLGEGVAAVHSAFDLERWQEEALDGFEELSLTDRARQLMRCLHRQLPADYEAAAGILVASLGPCAGEVDLSGMAPFIYLPHVYFVAEYGLADEHFEASMRAQYELTQRFTAEFSIRYFLERHPEATLARLRQWAADPNHHVRRLVSEGSRPRLPWAMRLKAFQRDPGPVLELLELLKDDPSLYVRRSVANNLNDIGKDHPEILAATCKRWLEGAGPERAWLVRHALRSAVKRGDKKALEVLGAGDEAEVEVVASSFSPPRPRRGQKVRFEAELQAGGEAPQKLVIDLAIFFVKANGQPNAKVFKLKNAELAPGEKIQLGKTIELADLTTRKHYPGWHAAELRVNGAAWPAGGFELEA
jgi:3-methyladenine DNA glycosylase AlkC